MAKLNGVKVEDEKEDNDADEEEQATPTLSEPQSPITNLVNEHMGLSNEEDAAGNGPIRGSSNDVVTEGSNGMQRHISQPQRDSFVTQLATSDQTATPSTEEDERLDAMAKERASLLEEVAQMRKSIEELQQRHETEMSGIREQLSRTEEGKEQAESQYQSLLGKVNTIRSQLGERLKADAVREILSKAGMGRD